MSGEISKLYRWLLPFILVLLVTFWLRVFDLNTLPGGLHTDEARNIERDWRLVQGYGLPLYFEDDPEPFDPIARAGFLTVAGLTIFNVRLFTGFLNVLTVAATIAAARVLFRDHPQREVVALVAGAALATIPSYVLLGRAPYRANWVPLMTMLALIALAWGMRARRTRYFAAAGIFTALAMMFYLAGVVFPVAVVLILLVEMTIRRRWLGWHNLFALAAAGGITLIPWLYLYIRIPGWLTLRVEQAGQGRIDPLANPSGFVGYVGRALRPIYQPDTYYDPRYNTYTTPFLNPALLVLLGIGLLVCLWRWRKPGALTPIILGAVLLMPGAMSGSPTQAIRLMGMFPPLALLAGVGAGAVVSLVFNHAVWSVHRGDLAGRPSKATSGLVVAALAGLLVYCTAYTYGNVLYHYTEQPRTVGNPNTLWSFATNYSLGYHDVLTYALQRDEPVYLPLDYLNTMHTTSWLRLSALSRVRPYQGEALPAGEVLLPEPGKYGLPEMREPVQYGLVSPQTREIVILPPLALTDAETLKRNVLTHGARYVNPQGWELGHVLPVPANANPFEQTAYRSFAPDTQLALFDNNLELVGADAPRDLTPGNWIPVTLYWRLRERSTQDYFAYVQVWDWQGNGLGNQEDQYAGIFRHLYPTVEWQPGEVVAETRWIQVYDHAPPGGYRIMVAVYTQPGPTITPLMPAMGVQRQENWLVAAHPVVPLPAFPNPPPGAHPINALLANTIRLVDVQFDPPLDQVRAGAVVTVTLYWQVIAPPPDDYILFLHLTDADGNLLAQEDSPPFDGRYPTSNWGVGEVVVTTHQLTLHGTGREPFSLTLGMYSYPSRDRVTVVQNGTSMADGLVKFP